MLIYCLLLPEQSMNLLKTQGKIISISTNTIGTALCNQLYVEIDLVDSHDFSSIMNELANEYNMFIHCCGQRNDHTCVWFNNISDIFSPKHAYHKLITHVDKKLFDQLNSYSAIGR